MIVGIGKVGYQTLKGITALTSWSSRSSRQGQSILLDELIDLGRPLIRGNGRTARRSNRPASRHAKAVILATSDDLTNLDAGLAARPEPAARVRPPTLRRVAGEQGGGGVRHARDLHRAGASPAFIAAATGRSVYRIPARRQHLHLTDLTIAPRGKLAGTTVGEFQAGNKVNVVMYRGRTGDVNPSHDVILHAGDEIPGHRADRAVDRAGGSTATPAGTPRSSPVRPREAWSRRTILPSAGRNSRWWASGSAGDGPIPPWSEARKCDAGSPGRRRPGNGRWRPKPLRFLLPVQRVGGRDRRRRAGIPSGRLPVSKTCRSHASGTTSDGSWGVDAGRSTTRRIALERWRQIWARDHWPTVEWPRRSRSTSSMTSSRLSKRSVRRPGVMADLEMRWKVKPHHNVAGRDGGRRMRGSPAFVPRGPSRPLNCPADPEDVAVGVADVHLADAPRLVGRRPVTSMPWSRQCRWTASTSSTQIDIQTPLSPASPCPWSSAGRSCRGRPGRPGRGRSRTCPEQTRAERGRAAPVEALRPAELLEPGEALARCPRRSGSASRAWAIIVIMLRTWVTRIGHPVRHHVRGRRRPAAPRRVISCDDNAVMKRCHWPSSPSICDVMTR